MIDRTTDDAALVRRLRKQRGAECVGEPCARYLDALDAADRLQYQASCISVARAELSAAYAAIRVLLSPDVTLRTSEPVRDVLRRAVADGTPPNAAEA